MGSASTYFESLRRRNVSDEILYHYETVSEVQTQVGSSIVKLSMDVDLQCLQPLQNIRSDLESLNQAWQ
jgi:hypothetical protein